MGGHRDAESRCAVARGAAGHGFWKGATAAQCWGRHRTAPLKMVTTASLCYVSCHTKQKTKKPKNPPKSQNKASRASPQASGPDFPAWSFSVPRGCGWGTGWGGGWSWECSRCPLPRDGRHRGDPGCPPPEAGGPKAPERKDRLRARRGRGSRGPALAVAAGRRPSAELPLQPPPLEA